MNTAKPSLITWERWHDPFKHAVGPVVMTEQGAIPIHKGAFPSKHFNFWVGHCAFDIGPDFFEEARFTTGVEDMLVWTRYRFRIAIGKRFDDTLVRHKIEQLADRLQFVTTPAMDKLAKELSRKHKFWAIGVCENGLETISATTFEEAEHKAQIFKGRASRVLTSW